MNKKIWATTILTQGGFDGVLYSFYPKSSHKESSIQPLITYSDKFSDFVHYYIQNDYGNRDFVLRMAFRGRRSEIDWWDEIKAGNVYPEERVVTQEARDLFGINFGLSIPALNGPHAISGISVISMNDSEHHFKRLKSKNLERLKQLCQEYHENVIADTELFLEYIKGIVATYSDTKKQVLRHVITGEPMKTIECMSPKNAEKILLNTRKEFGGIPTNKLIYLLGRMGADRYL